MASPLTKFTVPAGSEDKFDELMQGFCKVANESKTDLYVLITAAKDASGHSWCPDCRSTEPLLEKAFNGSLKGKAMIVVADVERAAYKGIPPPTAEADCEGGSCVRKVATKHIYKTHPQLLVPALPTLYKWDAGKNESTGKLVEEHCYDLPRLLAFLAVDKLE